MTFAVWCSKGVQLKRVLADWQLFFLLSTGRRAVDVSKGLITILLPLPNFRGFVGIAHRAYSAAIKVVLTVSLNGGVRQVFDEVHSAH